MWPLKISSRSEPALDSRRRGWPARAADFLWGDDIFISYSRTDASEYALALASGLTELGFSCYVDQWGTEPGHELPNSLKWTLSRSGALVVIASPGAAESRFVGEEVAFFRHLKRPILPVSVDGAETRAAWYGEIAGLAVMHDTQAGLQAGRPGSDVVARIRAAIEYQKRSARLHRTFRRVAAGTFALMLVAALVVGWASRRAAREARRGDSAAYSTAAAERMRVGDVIGALRLGLRAVALHESPGSLRSLNEILVRQPRLARAFRPHGVVGVSRLAFNGDGHRFATHGEDGSVRLWSLDSAGEIALLGEAVVDNEGVELAFSPRGEWVAAGTQLGMLYMWEGRHLRLAASIRVQSPVIALAFRRDGVLATADRAGCVAFWRIAPGRPLARIGAIERDSMEGVYALAFSPTDGTLAMTTPHAMLFTGPAGMDIRDSARADLGVRSVFPRYPAYAPDGRSVAAQLRSGTVMIVPAQRGRSGIVASAAGGLPEGDLITFGENGLFTVSNGIGAIIRWSTGQEQGWAADTLTRFPSWVSAIALVPRRGWLASAHTNGTLAFWALDADRALTRRLPDEVAVGAVDDAATRFILCAPTGVALWSRETGRVPLTAHPALAVAINAAGTLAAGAWADTLVLWDVSAASPAKRVIAQTGIAHPVRVRLSSNLIVVTDDSGRVFVSGNATPGRAHQLVGMTRVLAVAPDGRTLAGADSAGQLMLGELGAPVQLRPLSRGERDAAVVTAVFTRRGRELLSYHQDGTLVRWRLDGVWGGATVLDTLMTANRFWSTNLPVADAQFSGNGKRLAVSFWSELPLVWDVNDRAYVIAPGDRGLWSLYVGLSADGSKLVTYFRSAEADSVQLTDLSSTAWKRQACSVLSPGPGQDKGLVQLCRRAQTTQR